METIYTFIVFVFTYFLVRCVSTRTTLGQYHWFTDLENKLLYKFPKRENIIRDIFNFKGFHCGVCHTFWMSLVIFTFFFSLTDNLIFAFIVYILNVIENKK